MPDPDTNPPQPNDANGAPDQLPAALVAKLRELDGASSPTTDARTRKLDAAIFAAAAEHFAAGNTAAEQPTRNLGEAVIATIGAPVRGDFNDRSLHWRAIAAAILLVPALLVLALTTLLPHRSATTPMQATGGDKAKVPTPFAEADFNRDGHVNLLDAYLLQRRIEVQAKLDSAWDLTHDGRVDKQDVQAIAIEAVKLPTNGTSAAPTNGGSVPTDGANVPTSGGSVPPGGANALTGGASSLAPAERGRS